MTICKRCKSEKTYLISEEKFHNIFKCLDCSYMYASKFNDYCCQNPFLNITIDNKNPEKIRLHRQCQNCGGCIDRTKPLSHKKYGNEIRFEFSYENYNKWQVNIKEEEEILWDWIKKNNHETSNYAKYQNYLLSDKWKIKRAQVLDRDKNICQECKESEAQEVHHKTYDSLYNEPLEDLISVCKDCHLKIHIINDLEKKQQYNKTSIK